jgi:hypothetical protein
MRLITTQSSNQLHDIFGGGYVQEQHSDTALWNLPPSEIDAVIESLTVSMFDEVLKSLRAALSLR